MKKTIGTYFSQYFKMPHLFRDDLEEIEQVILKELKPKAYRLACGGFEYERLEDIQSEIEEAGLLVIYTHSPCMRLKLARSWAELYSGEDGTGIDKGVRRIAMIVSRNERRWLWGICKFAAWLAPLLGFGSLALAVGLINMGILNIRSLYMALWVMLIISIWWGISYRYMLHSFSRIDFQRPREPLTPLERHRDKILLFLTGAIFGGTTAWLLAKFFNLL